MNKFWRVCFLFLCVIASVFGQTNDTAFFRISSPSNGVITGFDAVAGTLTCSNAVVGVTNQIQRAYGLAGTSNWVDFVQLVSTASVVCTERIIDLDPPEGMVFIPGGIFQMGDLFREGGSEELPVHNVYVSGFYMGRHEVSKMQWDEIYNWAINHNYDFDHAGSGTATNHPVHSVSWYDVVKWCNAYSEMEGRTPCYTVGGSCYRTGQSAPDGNWGANGYRLPTEAEWEKAARGGHNDKRFGWGDLITHDNANYFSHRDYPYDVSSTRGYHPDYDDGAFPYTSPAGSFASNGFGLHDMAGNLWEWCWDWHDSAYYSTSPSLNPRGAAANSHHVIRGGYWASYAWDCRSARRGSYEPRRVSYNFGFRVCLPSE